MNLLPQVSGGARNEVTQRETKMDGLSVRLCEVGCRTTALDVPYECEEGLSVRLCQMGTRGSWGNRVRRPGVTGVGARGGVHVREKPCKASEVPYRWWWCAIPLGEGQQVRAEAASKSCEMFWLLRFCITVR